MKKRTAFCLIFFAVIMLVSSCSPYAAVTEQTPQPTAEAVTLKPTATPAPTPEPSPAAVATRAPVKGNITVYSFTDEVPNMCAKYIELHPEFPWEIKTVIIATTDNRYEPALDKALKKGKADIYCAESAFVTKYTQGKMSRYAMPYEQLGIDVSSKTTAAKTFKYIIEAGTRPSDGKVVGLGYQSTPGAFIYRRSIAKKTWGTDDPAVIKTKVGPGWDKFFEAAADLKAKGCVIVSGCGDIWHAVENSADKGWIVKGKLYIDPKREAFLDYAKKLIGNGYTNGTLDWTEGWYADMAGTGKKPVFGYFGPSWMINYVMPGSSGGMKPGEGTYGDWAICEPPAPFFWGGTWVLADKALAKVPEKKAAVAELLDWITLNCGEDGPQYGWANGALDIFSNEKDTVASGAVMENSDGTLAFLGGQDMYGVFLAAGQNINGGNITQYDTYINSIWRDYVIKYAYGNCTRKYAVAAFKKAVKRSLGFKAW